MVEFAQGVGSKGLAYLVWQGGAVKGPIFKFLQPADLEALASRCGIEDGDVLFFVSDKEGPASRIAGEVRSKLGHDLDLIPQGVYKFCWIVDFPMFEFDEELGRVGFLA
jgi:aspartyl-tRNA synthetase